jgi:hypothetical protein
MSLRLSMKSETLYPPAGARVALTNVPRIWPVPSNDT